MELKQFDGMKKEELSMIEVAHAILDEKGDVLEFSELVTAIQKYLGITVGKMKKNTPQFYTDLNIDGSFISLGENVRISFLATLGDFIFFIGFRSRYSSSNKKLKNVR